MSAGQPALRTLRHRLGPPWLVGPEKEAGLIGYSLDVIKDAALERLRLGLLARFPQGNGRTLSPSDALAALGADREVVRGIDEGDTAYAARLVKHLTHRRRQGSPFALMNVLQDYVGGQSWFRTVDIRGNYFTLSSSGIESYDISDWNWSDSDLARWARFWVIIYPGSTWSASLWGTAVWGTGLWGTTMTAGQLSTLQQIVAKWKPAGTKCVNIILAFDNDTFSPLTPEADATAVASAVYFPGSA